MERVDLEHVENLCGIAKTGDMRGPAAVEFLLDYLPSLIAELRQAREAVRAWEWLRAVRAQVHACEPTRDGGEVWFDCIFYKDGQRHFRGGDTPLAAVLSAMRETEG